LSIDEYLKATGMSATELARRSNLPDSAISVIRSGKVRPSMRNAIRILKATGGLVRIDDMLTPHQIETSTA
jgi:transcriptional regulator with XRE-family HTH domain